MMEWGLMFIPFGYIRRHIEAVSKEGGGYSLGNILEVWGAVYLRERQERVGVGDGGRERPMTQLVCKIDVILRSVLCSFIAFDSSTFSLLVVFVSQSSSLPPLSTCPHSRRPAPPSASFNALFPSSFKIQIINSKIFSDIRRLSSLFPPPEKMIYLVLASFRQYIS